MKNVYTVATALVVLTALAGRAQTELVAANTPRAGARAAQAETVVIGKVVEIERDTVEAPPYAGAPRDVKAVFKVAVVKSEEVVIGGKGLTQFRVGFPADAPLAGTASPVPPGAALPEPTRIGRAARSAVALDTGMEGCFFLSRYPGTDFYVADGGPLAKGEGYAKQLEEVRRVAKAIDEPLTALKSKELGDRFLAAKAILQRYQAPPPGRLARQPIPDDENRLLLDMLLELPWAPADGNADSPSRSGLWPLVRPAEFGFRQPKATGGDYNEMMDKATATYLKDNKDRIKIRRYAQ